MRISKCAVKNNGQICIIVAGLVLVGLTGAMKTEATGPFMFTGSLAVARSHFAAVLLQNGNVLVAGGQPQSNNCASTASAEIYDPTTGTWSQTNPMNRARYDFSL